MIGDGIELGYLQTYMVDQGFSKTQPATLLSVYGVAVALASWLSGALSERFSPHHVMMLGFLVWVVLEIPFLYFLDQEVYVAMLVTYFVRGFGYPLFAYGFLVWVTVATSEEQLGTAVAWFWFAFTGGLPTIASFVALGLIPIIGTYATFWFLLVFIAAGGLIALIGVREPTGREPIAGEAENPIRDLLRGITILWWDMRTGDRQRVPRSRRRGWRHLDLHDTLRSERHPVVRVPPRPERSRRIGIRYKNCADRDRLIAFGT